MTTVAEVLKKHSGSTGDIKTRVYWSGDDGVQHGLVRKEKNHGQYEVYSYSTGQIVYLTPNQIEKIVIEKCDI